MGDTTDTKRPKLTLGGEQPRATRLPAKVRLVRQHSFVEDGTGRHRIWHGGEIVADVHEIALLTERGAVLEALS
jgi:hypothetical protein